MVLTIFIDNELMQFFISGLANIWSVSLKISMMLYVFYMIIMTSATQTDGEACKIYQVPIRGKALVGHTYKTAKAEELFRCYVRCERDPGCKNCNFKHTQELCEMNNETKVAKPQDFISYERSYYIPRIVRGGYHS